MLSMKLMFYIRTQDYHGSVLLVFPGLVKTANVKIQNICIRDQQQLVSMASMFVFVQAL